MTTPSEATPPAKLRLVPVSFKEAAGQQVFAASVSPKTQGEGTP